jgi:hypothetical protein
MAAMQSVKGRDHQTAWQNRNRTAITMSGPRAENRFALFLNPL